MARRQFVRGGSALRQGQRRETLWIGQGLVASTLAAINSTVIQTSLNASALALRPFTIIRHRIFMYLTSDQEAASELQFAAFGACVVSDQARAIGISAVPTPVTDVASDLWYAHRWMGSGHGAGTVDSQRGTAYEIDSKAMRKVEEGQDVITVVENATGDGVILSVAGRLLVKLH